METKYPQEVSPIEVQRIREAAEQDDAEAQYNLGHMYLLGQGVARDVVQAHFWLNVAATLGNADAQKICFVVENEMSTEQINQALELAREWLDKYQE